MASFSARRLRSACALTATAAVALALPGVAAAKKPLQCSGLKAYIGAGSTLQKNAITKVWSTGFINPANPNPASCNGVNGSGEKPVMTEYKSIGSGPGMQSWGLEGNPFNSAVTFVATDEAPNEAQKAELEAEGSPLYTFPVLQESVASIVHLPAGCTASNAIAGDAGRLVLGNETLAEIWEGKLNTWAEVIATPEDAAAGDELKGTCGSSPFTRFVRNEGSGTTHIFKSYLNLVSTRTFATSLGTKNWDELKEGPGNTVWPTAASVNNSPKGGGALVEAVLNTENSIGYAALTDSRAKVGTAKDTFAASSAAKGTTGGAGTETFWTPLENKKKTATEAATYADPSEDNETSTVSTKANCTGELYTNGTKVFPPKKTALPWNAVTTKTEEPNYTLCGLTFDLAYTSYGTTPFGAAGPAAEKTVGDLYKYILATGPGGGQTEANSGWDYEELTSQLLTIADKGLKKIK